MTILTRYIFRILISSIVSLLVARLYFSSDSFQSSILSQIRQSCIGCQVQLSSIEADGLLGFKAHKFEFQHQSFEKPIHLESLKISVAPITQVLSLKLPISIEAEFPDGGRLLIQTSHTFWKSSSFQSLENIKVVFLNTYFQSLQEIFFLFRFLPVKLSFLNARMKGVFLINQGKGKGSLRIYEPMIHIPGGSPLILEQIRTKVQLQNGSLNFDPIKLKSKIGEVTVLTSLDPFPYPENFRFELRGSKENHLAEILGRITNCKGTHTRLSGKFKEPFCFRFPPGSLPKK